MTLSQGDLRYEANPMEEKQRLLRHPCGGQSPGYIPVRFSLKVTCRSALLRPESPGPTALGVSGLAVVKRP